jgi:hypothetical protein
MSYSYSIVRGEIVIQSTETGQVLWAGKPYGIQVDIVLPVPEKENWIVLLNWEQAMWQKKKNIICLNLFGNIVWEVEHATIEQFGVARNEVEIYTGMRINKEGDLMGYSWSGYSDQIDMKTGKIVKSDWVK